MTIHEPIASFTSLAFVAAAVLVALGPGPESSLLVAAFALAGASSFMFHLSGSERNTPAHRADEGSIYGLVLAITYHMWNEPAWLLVLGSIALGFVLLNLKKANLLVIAPAASVAALIGLWVNHGTDAALHALAFVAMAGVARVASEKYLSDVLHGAWHVLITYAALYAWCVAS